MLYFNNYFVQSKNKPLRQSPTAAKNLPQYLTPILQAKVAPNSNGGPSSILTDRTYGARI